MKLTEQELRAILQRQGAGRRNAECLTADQFARAAAGEMSEEERRDVARHLVVCMDCTEEYRAARALEPWARELQRDLQASQTASGAANPPALQPFQGEEVVEGDSKRLRFPRPASQELPDSETASSETFHPGGRPRRRIASQPGTRAILAVAAMLVIAATSIFIWQSSSPRDPGQSSQRSGLSFTLTVDPPNDATLVEPPASLSWSPLEHTLAYRVLLYDYQSTPIWESARLTTTSIVLPEEIRKRLSRNQTYYWRVIAEDAIEQRQSELFRFTLNAPPSRN
jgi:hypothetical protein